MKNFFSLIIEWFKTKVFKTESGEELTEVLIDETTEEIKQITFNLFSTIVGYKIKNLNLDFNSMYKACIPEVSNTKINPTKLTLTNKDVDFSKLGVIETSLDLVSDTKEVIRIMEVKLGFDESFVENGKIYYRFTPQNLCLRAITFNAAVDDYTIIEPEKNNLIIV